MGQDLNHLVEKSLLVCKLRDANRLRRARSAIRGMVLVAAHHGACQKVLDSLTEQLSAFYDVDELEFVTRAKYVFTYLQARFLRNDVPPAPSGWTGFHGAFKRWIKSRLICYNRKNVHLFFSLLQAKRSCEPLSKAYVRDVAYPSHRAAMQTPDPLSGNEKSSVEKRTAFFEAVRPVLRNIRSQLERVSDQRLWLKEHKGSQSASFEASRADGGQAAAIGRELGVSRDIVAVHDLGPFPVGAVDFGFLSTRQIDKISWYPRLEHERHVAVNIGGETIAVKGVTVSPGIDVKRIHADHDFFVSEIRSAAHRYGGKHLTASVYAVLEPLKVRMITKGNAVPYYFSKGLQKSLHSIMRRIPAFRLIGRPACPTDLIDLVVKKKEDSYWISGDYKASTDNVSGVMGLMYMAYLVEDLDDDDIATYLSVFGYHWITYPADKRMFRRYKAGKMSYDEFEEYMQSLNVLQTNGQLMGSILSFPILCLLNLSLYLRVRAEHSGRFDFELEMSRVLINGDDILFVGTSDEYKTFVRLGDELGLSTSVGKTYVHPRYANVNSTCFDFDLRSANATPLQIDYLNTGLYYGLNKVMGRDDEDSDPRDLVATINRVLSGALPSKAAQILKNFLHIHRDEVNAVTRGRNLFIHESLGGCGVRRPLGFALRVSDEQHVRALLLYKGTNHPVARTFPRNTIEIQSPTGYVEPWETVVPRGVEGRIRKFKCDHAWIQRRRLPDWLLEVGIAASS